MLHTMIMAGGGGTRFWPRSRQRRPKQFLALGGERTLLQQAADRILGLVPRENCWVVTAEAYRNETARQLPEFPSDHVVGEPCGRDTAACISLGAGLIARQDPHATMLIMSADHLIEPVGEFRRAVRAAAQTAEEHPAALVTFGIPPSFPATGYGYIQRGPRVAEPEGVPVYQVERFREKPSAEMAEQFLRAGNYFWNSGLFVWKAATILNELATHQPKTHAATERIADAWNTASRFQVFSEEYTGLPKISIDYGVMEHAQEVLVVQAPFRWDDVGSWLALPRLRASDEKGNTVVGEHFGIDTKGCIIVADKGHFIATAAVKNLIIVQDGDVTLVADAANEASIKNLVERMRQEGWERYL